MSNNKNSTLLRKLMQIESNKKCFECNAKGITYVDLTIGSFVCSLCGGLLRGLTIPHRVKSISMGTFTSSEIAFLESKGNKYCFGIYLGQYPKSKGKPDCSDPAKLQHFMEKKYQQKLWYLSPQEVNKPLDSFMKSLNVKQGSDNVRNKSQPRRLDPARVSPKIQQVNEIQKAITSGSVVSAQPSDQTDFADFSTAFSKPVFDPFGSIVAEPHTTFADISSSTFDSIHTFGDFSNSSSRQAEPCPDQQASVKAKDKYANLENMFNLDSNECKTWSCNENADASCTDSQLLSAVCRSKSLVPVLSESLQSHGSMKQTSSAVGSNSFENQANHSKSSSLVCGINQNSVNTQKLVSSSNMVLSGYSQLYGSNSIALQCQPQPAVLVKGRTPFQQPIQMPQHVMRNPFLVQAPQFPYFPSHATNNPFIHSQCQNSFQQ